MSKVKKPRVARGKSSLHIPANRIWPPVAAEDLVLCDPPAPVEQGVYLPPGSFSFDRGPVDAMRYFERSARNVKPLTIDEILNNRIFDIDNEALKRHVVGEIQWRFIFGRDQGGGGGGGSGKGSGKSQGDGESGIDIDYDKEEIEDTLFKNLELPNLIKKKAAPQSEVVGHKLSGLGPAGSRAELSLKDSLRRRARRVAALMSSNPELKPPADSPFLVPPISEIPLARRDKRYWQFEEIREPITQAVLYALVDRSPSVDEAMLKNIYLFYNLKFRFLKKNYKHVELVMVAHGTKHVLCATEDEFRTVKVDMGTAFRDSLQFIRQHALETYNPDSWNCYLDQATDGDMSDSEDEMRKDYRDLIDAGFNYITYLEVTSESSGRSGRISWDKGGRAIQGLPQPYLQDVYLAKIWNKQTVFEEFVKSLRKDAIRTKS